jgi:excisionase family DNA binding protein
MEILTTKDVAKELGVTNRTARNLFESGRLKGNRAGVKKYITTPELLKEFVEGKKSGPTV